MSLCGRMCTALWLPLCPVSQRSVCKLIPRPAPLAAMANTSGTAKRPCRFVLGTGVPQPSPKKIPRAGSLVTTVKPLPPPDAVRAVLLPELAVLFAVDVETHVMIPTQPKGLVMATRPLWRRRYGERRRHRSHARGPGWLDYWPARDFRAGDQSQACAAERVRCGRRGGRKARHLARARRLTRCPFGGCDARAARRCTGNVFQQRPPC